MAVENRQAYCHRCGEMRLHIGQAQYRVPHLAYFISLTLFVCIWLPISILIGLVWIFHVLANLAWPGRIVFLCSQCGQLEGVLTVEQQSALAAEQARLDNIRAEIRTAARRKRTAAKIEARRQRRIRAAHRAEIRRGLHLRRWQRFDAWVARTVGEENEILVDGIQTAARTLVWVAPWWALAAAAIIAWSVWR